MKTYFPYFFRKIGIVLVFISFIVSLAAGANALATGFEQGINFGKTNSPELYPNIHIDENHNIYRHYNTVISPKISHTLMWIGISMSFVGFLLYLFSKERMEDELIQKIRSLSLEKSLIFTWALVFILLLFKVIYGFSPFLLLQIQLVVYVILYQHYKLKYDIR